MTAEPTWTRATLPDGPHEQWQPSERMIEILDRAAAGPPNPEIAAALHVGESTVKAAMNTIATRFGISERPGVIGEAFRRGYLLAIPGPPLDLEPGEADLLRAYARGGTRTRIAGLFCVHASTISTRAAAVAKHLGARNIVHAVAIWQSRGENRFTDDGDRLTPRVSAYHRQVLELLAAGATHRQIAARLGVAPSSVETRIARLRAWAQCEQDAGVVGWAYRSGLIFPPLREPVTVTGEIAAVIGHIAHGDSLAQAAARMGIGQADAPALLAEAHRAMRTRTIPGLVTAAYATGLLAPEALRHTAPGDAVTRPRGPTELAA